MVRTANLMFAVLVVIALQSAMPAHVSAGRLKAEIIVIYQTCVGQELRLLARLTNENGDPVGTTTTRIEIRDFDDTQVLHTSSNDVRQIGGNAWEEFEMGSGWTPSEVGTYNVHLISDGENNDNGEQDFSFFTTICEGIQCPLRPTAEADNFYLDETGYASIRYLVEDGCCYRLKLTVIDPDGAVTVKVPEEWVNISGNYGVYVRVDRTKLTGRPIRAYVEFANCQGQNPGRDDYLIIEGDELADTAFVDLNSGYELINSGEDGDPVIMSSLEQRIGSTPDITMGGPGGIDLVRTYHSKIDQNGAVGGDFGPGWSHNHEWRIREATNSVYVYGPDNMLIKFRRVGDGLEPVDVDSYDPTRFRLRRAPEGGYRFTWIKNETETIGLSTDTDGRVRSLHRVRWVDGDFQEEVYYYTYENGVLKRIRTQDGRELNIDRNANNKISQLSTDDQQVTFEYSANVLNSVTDAVGLTTTYTTKPGTHYITNVVTPDGGSSMTINMDDDGSVVSHAIGENYTVEFTLSDDRSAVLYPGGLEKVFVHDDRANLQSVNLGDYGEATFNYGAFNRRTLINDFVDGETTIEFTDDGLKKRLTFDETNPVDFTYGQYGFDDFEYPAVDKIQVENGAGVTFARDEHGRHNSMTFSNGLRLILPRDVNGNMTQYSSVDGRTDIDHDELGRISGLHFFDGSAETMLYSSFGHLSKIDREGEDEDVEWSRDLKARLVKFREGEVTWDLTWTGDDQPESVTDGEGRTSQYQYDENRRLWKVTRGTTSPLSMELNWNGPYPTDLGRAHMTYNDFGWVSEYSPAPGSDIQLSYDGEGNINGVRLNGEYQWEIERNKRGLPMKYVLPDGRQTEFDWDGNNRLKNSKSADGILREYSSEPDGSGGTVIAPLGIKMSFGISFQDENTYTLRVTDPNGHDWSMTQQGDSGMRTFTSPLGSTQVNLYDPIWRLQSSTLSDGSEVTYKWLQDHIIETRYMDEVYTRQYDRGGLCSEVNGDPITRDEYGRVIEANGTRVWWDEYDQMTGIGTTDRRLCTYSYEGLFVNQITDWDDDVTTLSWNDLGLLEAIVFPNAYTLTYTYTPVGQVTRIESSDGWFIAYEYDGAGRLIKESRSDDIDISTPPRDHMFSFDADNKLEGAEYDALGNLTRYEAMSLSMGYSFGGLKSFGSNNTVDLDPYGQIQSIETVPGTWSVVFTPLTDTPGLLEMRAPGGKEWTYAILPNGQILYGKEADGSICIFLPDAAGNVVAETNGEGGYTHEQLFTVHLDRVGGEWGDVPLGAGGQYGGITMINGEGEDGVEIVIEDGGKKVTVPEAKRRASSEDPTPGFPNGSDPLKENTEATSGVVNLDNILEAMDQHLGGGLIQRDQDPEDKGEQVAPSPEEVKRSTTTIEPGPSLRGLRGVDYLKKLEFYYFDPGYKYEDEENRGFDRGAYALDDGVLKLPADVDPSKLSVDEKIEVVQTLTQDFTRTPYDKLIDILFPEKNAAPNSTARDQNGAKREQKGALVIERSAVGVEVRPNTNTPNVK